jgi:hypothetical protein
LIKRDQQKEEREGEVRKKREREERQGETGLPGPKKLKRPYLAISSFIKGQILKNEKGQIKAKFPAKKLLK